MEKKVLDSFGQRYGYFFGFLGVPDATTTVEHTKTAGLRAQEPLFQSSGWINMVFTLLFRAHRVNAGRQRRKKSSETHSCYAMFYKF